MPTPKQLHAMKEFYARPPFVVNEVVDLPSSDEEDFNHEEEIKASNNIRIQDQKDSLLDDDDFEPQNEQERLWKNEETNRMAKELDERNQGRGQKEKVELDSDEKQWRCYQQKVVQSMASASSSK
jgi:hypothetical protein